MEKKGKLIILEAGDASGKETQTRLLYERLLSEGRNVTRVSFPDYESDSSALVKMYLRGDFGAQGLLSCIIFWMSNSSILDLKNLLN